MLIQSVSYDKCHPKALLFSVKSTSKRVVGNATFLFTRLGFLASSGIFQVLPVKNAPKI